MEYQIMFYGGLAGALITLIISIIVYMKLQISQVFADLTGNRFKRKKNDRISLEAQETKRTTSEIKLRKKEVPVAVSIEDTALMSEELEAASMFEAKGKVEEPTVLLVEGDSPEETTLLQDGVEETSLLQDELEETTLLANELEETSLLQDEDETTLLVEEDETSILLESDGETSILTEVEEDFDFEIEVDVMIVHTNKVIEQRSVVK
ncbi:hypothetical protein V7112_14885 [Bacillus sp. JJ1566]|uniref:hypothetical protein n=1 Tax=Bacillus sp. JJ1566 TaxID=3122961 RepID=UPI002FFFC69C